MKKEELKFILTSISGNVLEWYDFALYGYFATVIAKLYFPVRDDFISLMLTLGVFATGFIARPVGGIVFGHLGDRYGRRFALIVSIILMMIPTGLIGLLPTYKTIGIFAPLLLTLFRIVQGIAVSGELTGAGTFLLECATTQNRGFYGSLIMCSTYLGLLIGAALCVLISCVLSADQVASFGWRIPFMLSFFFGLGALILRLQCEESPIFQKMIEEKKVLQSPASTAIKYHFKKILLICLISSSLAVAIYLLIGFFPSYFVLNKKMTLEQAMAINVAGLFALTLCVPLMGRLTDIIGNKSVICFGSIGFLLFSYKIFELASRGDFISALFSVILTAIFLSPIAASLIFTIARIFPANVRYSSMSIGYNISMTIFGGTTPLIAMYVNKYFKTDVASSTYLWICSLITLIAVYFIHKNKKNNF